VAIDDFGALNATHGRQVTDGILADVADLLVVGTRREDVVGRLSGAIFAVLLASGGERHARRFANRIRRDFAARAWSSCPGV